MQVVTTHSKDSIGCLNWKRPLIYRDQLAPYRSALNGTHLVGVPDGTLSGVPQIYTSHVKWIAMKVPYIDHYVYVDEEPIYI